MKRVRPVELFVSYSHRDVAWFRKLQPLLRFQVPTNPPRPWHDQEMKAGDRWDREIRAALEVMDVFLCLVSYCFLDSGYITDVEMKAALRREQQGKTIIVPLLIEDMDERDIVHLRPFNPLPAWDRSWLSYKVTEGHTRFAHKPIRTGLLDAIAKVRP